MKVSLDRYRIYSNKYKRLISVIVFNERRIYAYDDYPESSFLAIDGDEHGYRKLGLAYAILTQDPNVIIYFPVDEKLRDGYFQHNFVLLRKELQFRHSEWFELKKKLKKKNLADKYHFSYNREDLLQEAKRLEENGSRYRYKERTRFYWEKHDPWVQTAENTIGETIFLTDNRYDCIMKHQSIVEGLRSSARVSSFTAAYTVAGWVGQGRWWGKDYEPELPDDFWEDDI